MFQGHGLSGAHLLLVPLNVPCRPVSKHYHKTARASEIRNSLVLARLPYFRADLVAMPEHRLLVLAHAALNIGIT